MMNKILSQKFLLIGIILAALVPLIFDNRFYLNIFILILLFATVANAWNVLGGYGGQLSLGHAIFFGLGAYTSSLLFLKSGLSPWLGLLAAVLVSIIAGIVIGFPTFRLKGPYFTLATIAFGEVIRHIALFWRSLTNGSMGVNIPFEPSFTNMIFKEYETYYWLALILFLISLSFMYWVDRTKVGYYLRAIREDQDSAQTLGINTTKYKMIAMILSAGLAGAAGVLYGQYMLYFEPENIFNLNLSIEFVLIVIVGGIGTIYGPLLGAAIVIPLNEILRSSFPMLNGMNFFIYGIVLILIVAFLPNGLLPFLKDLLKGKLLNRKRVKSKIVED
ncbi:branched-chain amino acid ABC transporter permease [Pseudogracilibacillus sp. SE30717A]|uniref:branched-chain amino acid ABC transporter permease n=1 Tax=Pseudogracilibacillus sp. SE30717A TaxID=3098293 RepID=UPI00300DD967